MSDATRRTFGPTDVALRNRTSVAALLVIIGILGVSAYLSVPKEANPEITVPIIHVGTYYGGVAPKDMETLVTRVLEEELNKIPDITVLTSTSDMGYSGIIAEFDNSMDMDAAMQKVRERIDLAKPKLPADADDPIVSELNLADWPIMQVNISGEYGLVRLKEVAEDLKERLEQIPSILDVRLSGGLEREVRVDVDLAHLHFYGVSFNEVIGAIRAENVTIPGGSIDVGTQAFLVRIAGEFQDTDIIGGIVIKLKDGRPVYVRDVATVDFGFQDRRSFARLNGNPVVTLDIVKRSGENIIATADAVKATIDARKPAFPPSTEVAITSDFSKEIRSVVSSLENSIISGLILVVTVLLFFLGVRNSGFVALSIPLSMLLSFIVMKMVGMTMNNIVLYSLILALGMLVDNAIVVVENIYRHIERGYDNFEAARLATGEVAMPIIVSTATTLGAFLPLLFWPGIVGEFMGYMPKTLIITLTSSLFVALVIIPPLCAMFMRLDSAPRRPLPRAARWTLMAGAGLLVLVLSGSSIAGTVMLVLAAGGVYALHVTVLYRMSRWFQERGIPRAVDSYERRLRWALAHRGRVMAGAAAVFAVTIALFTVFGAGSEYFPESVPPSSVTIRVDVPSGTAASFTDDITRRIEARLADVPGMHDAESVVTTVSENSAVGFFGSSAEGNVTINFVDYDQRTSDVFETLATLQAGIGDGIAGADIRVEKPQNGPPSGKPVNVEIVGPEVEQLKVLADRVMAALKANPVYSRLEGLENDMAGVRPELVIEVDRERAALHELSTSQIGGTIRTAIQGATAAKYRAGKDEYDIVVRLAERYRNDVESLRDLTIAADGRQVPLLSVARWQVDEGLGTVRRKDLDRVATVSADVRAGEQSNAVLAEVRRVLQPTADALPPGYVLRYTGQQEDQQESMDFLMSAFLIALLLIGFILMSQFNSVLKPLIIMTSVVMSIVGVLLGLLVFRMPFGIIMTGVGIISLAGVVVNNAIVLIDYIDLLRQRDGMTRIEAIVEACRTRFRPVLLTAVTTVLGLVPLAIGFNIDFIGLFRELQPNIYWGGEQAAWWGPMAIAVIAGLAFATVLTLGMVPVMYSLLDDLGDLFGRHFTHEGQFVEVSSWQGRRQPRSPPAHRRQVRRRQVRRRGAAASGNWYRGSRTRGPSASLRQPRHRPCPRRRQRKRPQRRASHERGRRAEGVERAGHPHGITGQGVRWRGCRGRARPARPGALDLRLPRPERGGQDHDDQAAAGPVQADRGLGHHLRAGHRAGQRGHPPSHRLPGAGAALLPVHDGAGDAAVRGALLLQRPARRHRVQGRRGAGPGRPGGPRRPAGPRLLGRRAPAARHRAGAGQRPGPPDPR
jgi:multidrug efflux pump